VSAVAHDRPGVAATWLGVVYHVTPWLLLGMVLAAFLEPLWTATSLAGLRGGAGVAVAVALGRRSTCARRRRCR